MTVTIYSADGQSWTAAGDGVTPDDGNIQAVINHMTTTFGGGNIYLPPGQFLLANPITITGKVHLVGAGKYATVLSVSGDHTAVYFDTTCGRGCGIERMNVYGFSSQASTSNAIFVDYNVPAELKDAIVWYGSSAMYTRGIDLLAINVWFNGCNNSVWSDGGGKYTCCNFDANGSFTSYQYAFSQGQGFTGIDSLENYFSDCDFSQSASSTFQRSVKIQTRQNGPYGFTKFSGCNFGAIEVDSAYSTVFAQCEFYSTTFIVSGATGGAGSVVGCTGMGVSIVTPAAWQKAANINIT